MATEAAGIARRDPKGAPATGTCPATAISRARANDAWISEALVALVRRVGPEATAAPLETPEARETQRAEARGRAEAAVLLAARVERAAAEAAVRDSPEAVE
jgi:hypothetical protein